MKFCHVLENTQQRWPEYRALFLFYKNMKKMLKTLAGTGEDSTSQPARAAEDRFVDTLCQQIRSLNVFRLERQQVAVRTLVDLQADMGVGGFSEEERDHTYQLLVNFHGETLLLMHWSILGYTAIVKLLKKHHKRTGLLVQAPHLRELLSQPSWSTEGITSIISQAETCINQLQTEIFSSRGEVVGPHNPNSSSSSEISAEKEALYRTLVSLANGEDSGEDSTGMHDDDEQVEESGSEAISAGNSNHPSGQLVSSAHGSFISNLHGRGGPAAGLSPPTGSSHGLDAYARSSEVSVAQSQPAPENTPEDAPDDDPFVNVPLLQQMQTALRTWEYLHTNASTPSTVLRGG